MSQYIEEVALQMQAMGMVPPETFQVGIGRITRYGKKRNSWYILHEHRLASGATVVVGAFGDWALQINQKVEVDWTEISGAEREKLQREMRKREQAEADKREHRAHVAANRARLQWRGAYTVEQADEKGVVSAYCARKGITLERVRLFDDGTLLVPMYSATDDAAKLVGLQKISPGGEKRFNSGMAKQGASCRLGPLPDKATPTFICEGYATGRSIRMALPGSTVYVAFDSGNLLHVAKELRLEYPATRFVFCADDDWKTEVPKGSPYNPGVVSARKAAQVVGNASILVPVFPDAKTRDDKWTDFNDLHVHCGLDAVSAQINAAWLPAETVDTLDDAYRDAGAVFEDANTIFTPEVPTGDLGYIPVPAASDEYADWVEKPFLQSTEKGVLKATLHNVETFMHLHKTWNRVVAYDEFAELPVKVAGLPWDDVAQQYPTDWTQIDHDRCAAWFSSRSMEVKDQSIVKAINIVSHRHKFNGPKEYLEGVQHDGFRRTRTWLIDYLGACGGSEFNAMPLEEQDRIRRYCELAGEKWLIGAVRRVLYPGCKMDNMLILEGDQGRMKSTVFKVLGGDWFTDAPLELDGAGLKDSLMVLQGRWIIEIPEIESLNKASTGAIKRFLAQDTDLFRPPYGAMLKKAKRRCTFGGTVNHDVYLKDDSGNRRFWPVKCWRNADIDRLIADRDQLWAEAVALAGAGVRHWVEGDDERKLFEGEQDKRFQDDAWAEKVNFYLLNRDRASMGDILLSALQIEAGRWEKAAQTRVGSIMRRLGWVRRRDNIGAREYYYARPDDPASAISGRKGDDAPF